MDLPDWTPHVVAAELDDDGGRYWADDQVFDTSGFCGVALSDGLPVDELHQRPKLYHGVVNRRVLYENALDFVKGFDLHPGNRAFAFINGDFIVGDILEALIDARVCVPQRATIMSLSMSEENVDSLVNVREMCGDEFGLHLVLSGYFYAMKKKPGGLVQYIRDELPWATVSYAPVHAKVMAVESAKGTKFVVHGSANLRSSRSIENIAIEADADLHDYIVGFAGKIAQAYAVQGVKTGTTKSYWEDVAK